MNDFPSAYDPKAVEDEIYKIWESSGLFNPDTLQATSYKLQARKRPAFSIVLPPPNVTGTLHLGHATMLAIEDIMVRFHRMKGDETVWIPGTDHAAIATQNVVEKELWQEEKKTRHDLGRERFLKKVEEFVEKSKNTIHRQIRKMGASLDWSREAYTLDELRERAVRTVFKMMYDDGLIYRGDRIVNWCTRCQSTLADDEVEYIEQKTPFYYFRYGPVVIGTARPETKFRDKVIVVHPDDERYRAIMEKTFEVEWILGPITARVLTDPIVDPTLGTGAMTITPAHSFDDFALAQKYNLEVLQIVNEQGRLTQAAGAMQEMPVAQARKKVVEILKEKGLIERIDENYVHNLSICYRCSTPVEPLVSKQWFIDVGSGFRVQGLRFRTLLGKDKITLKELAIAVVKKGLIEIIPERFNKIYFHWMESLHDWCISRQIWFGHRIPVWYCHACNDRHPELVSGSHNDVIPAKAGIQTKNISGSRIKSGMTDGIIVSVETPTTCPTCGSQNLEQDPDTLDTWFSSGLWTFSTLGWDGTGSREQGAGSSDLQRFHPTSVLETGYDILFFWVARMILMTTYVLGDIPFKTVYLHGLIRDEQGRKMSKSIGNTIDPLVVSEKYGTDAVRLALVVGTTPGNDIKLSEKKIAGFRNFVNKLWNVARYIDSQRLAISVQGLGGESQRSTLNPRPSSLADRWILSRLQRVIASVTDDLDHYRLSQAAETLRAFTWDEVADWYVEISKSEIRNPKSETTSILYSLLTILLRLWHPFTPFVTEAIGSKISEISKLSTSSELGSMLMIQPWPTPKENLIGPKAEAAFVVIQDIVTAIRQIRSAYQLESALPLDVVIESIRHRKILDENKETIGFLTKTRVADRARAEAQLLSAHVKTAGVRVRVDVGRALDVVKQLKRVREAIAQTQGFIRSIGKLLSNKEFTKNAPEDVVIERRRALEEHREKLKDFEVELEELRGMR